MKPLTIRLLIALTGAALSVGAAPSSGALIYLRLHDQLAADGGLEFLEDWNSARWTVLAGFLGPQLKTVADADKADRSTMIGSGFPVGPGVYRRSHFAASRAQSWIPVLGPSGDRVLPTLRRGYRGPSGALSAGRGAARFGAGSGVLIDNADGSAGTGAKTLGTASPAFEIATTQLQLSWYLNRIAELRAAEVAAQQPQPAARPGGILKPEGTDVPQGAALATRNATAIPEPSAAALLLIGALGLLALRRRRYRSG